ncbi:hypothetical protein BB560_006039 [Smittium megazygosporum]|uniref:EXPERA domain-containing protein n=1 Tax=Smittium megazygosporum TaxID=133381 RepID=A0A2T9YK25_9FUNG|nr:hypothetical protein BB560_006682 [Smittium megazygosporum]PVU92678.1 hypothetical protein BB560_006039 [Smittium megazygosporum]
MSQESASFTPSHPYFPTLLSIPHFQPSELPTTHVLMILGGVALVILIFGRQISRTQSGLDSFATCWFLLCFFIHVFLEGYFVVFNKTLAGKKTLLADLWREYSLSDSRYLISDPFTVIMEGITAAIDGPLSLVVVIAILNRNFALRHLAQLSVSIAQLYGDVLYLLTNYFEAYAYTHPHPYYFWVYFVAMNLPWIILPIFFIFHSWISITKKINSIPNPSKIKSN